MNIEQYSPQSGRFLKEDGTYINIADALGGTETGQIADIEKHAAHSGRFIKEDGTVINIAESIGSGGGGGGGSSDDSATPIIEEYNGQVIQSFISADRPLQGLKLFATTKQATTTGAQLWDVEKAKKLESWVGLSSYKHFDIQLKSNTTYCLFVSENNMYKDYKAEYISAFAFYIGEAPNRSETNTLFGDCDANKDAVLLNKTFTTTENPFYFNLFVSNWKEEELNIVFDELLKNIMLVEGSSVLPYEPYTGGKPSPSLEYPQEIQTISDFVVEVKNSTEGNTTPQTLNVTIPEQGFYGIPVKSGGNYTDSTGQQWICDEFDFTNKKFIKRTGRIEFDGSSDENWILNSATEERTRFYINVVGADGGSTQECLCNRAIYGTTNDTDICFFTSGRFYINADPSISSLELWRQYLPTHELDVIYQLETPIEYDLTNEQVEQFKKLRSYYGTTYIDNDAVPACNMQAELVLDTKLYIDNKFTTLAGQILEMGV